MKTDIVEIGTEAFKNAQRDAKLLEAISKLVVSRIQSGKKTIPITDVQKAIGYNDYRVMGWSEKAIKQKVREANES